ncbi:unnamed protein product, partial [Amoebophrya sp. A120]|eukprot:GSA120T00022483001.1
MSSTTAIKSRSENDLAILESNTVNEVTPLLKRSRSGRLKGEREGSFHHHIPMRGEFLIEEPSFRQSYRTTTTGGRGGHQYDSRHGGRDGHGNSTTQYKNSRSSKRSKHKPMKPA